MHAIGYTLGVDDFITNISCLASSKANIMHFIEAIQFIPKRIIYLGKKNNQNNLILVKKMTTILKMFREINSLKFNLFDSDEVLNSNVLHDKNSFKVRIMSRYISSYNFRVYYENVSHLYLTKYTNNYSKDVNHKFYQLRELLMFGQSRARRSYNLL